jgi:hypothetical protein
MVHISQFYNCDKITTGAELFLACELGKYLKERGEELSLEGVVFAEELKHSKFWLYYSYALSNNFICKQGIYNYELIDSDLITERGYFMSSLGVSQPVFALKTDAEWIWQEECESTTDRVRNTKIMCGTSKNQSLLSLVAYAMVSRLFDGVPEKLVLNLSENFTNQEASTALVLIVKQNTNAFEGWLDIRLTDVATALYQAWVFNNIDSGISKQGCSVVERKNYFNKCDYQIGDIVLFYRRNERQNNNVYRGITDCSIATIFSITDSHITLNIINTNETTLTTRKRLDSYSADVRAMYPTIPPLRLAKESNQWMDIGIGRQTYLEQCFILPLNVADQTTQWVERDINGVHEEEQVVLNSIEAVYWIMRDRNISFNEEHFKQLYFKDSQPLYDIYMQGYDIYAKEVQ